MALAAASTADDVWGMDFAVLRARVVAATSTNGSSHTTGKRTVYTRSRDVRIYVLRRAPARAVENPPRSRTAPGSRTLSPTHHAPFNGEPDHPRHVIGLCPTCHRCVHHGEDGSDFTSTLMAALSDAGTDGLTPRTDPSRPCRPISRRLARSQQWLRANFSQE